MTPEEVRALIAQGEGQRLELKRSLAELEAGTRAAAAMANTDGGHVLFGVRGDGSILGVQIGSETRERVVQAVTELEDRGSFFAVTFYGPGDRILDLIPEEGVTDLRELGLNGRQIEALRLMVNEGRGMTNAMYQELFEVSRRTATRDLRALTKTRWVRQKGTGKGTRYVANRDGA